MWNPFANERLTRAQVALDKVYDHLDSVDVSPDSKEFADALKNAVVLEEIVSKEKRSHSIDPNIALQALAYAGTGVGIMVFESFGHSITTRAAQYAWPKLRM